MTDVLLKVWRRKKVTRMRRIPVGDSSSSYGSGIVYARQTYSISEEMCLRLPNTSLADLRGDSIDKIIDECKTGSRQAEGVGSVERKLLSDKRYYTPY